MKCPNCRSEVLNDPVCPYCGTMLSQPSHPTQSLGVPEGHMGNPIQALERRIRALETKISIAIALLSGLFALTILILIVLVLK